MKMKDTKEAEVIAIHVPIAMPQFFSWEFLDKCWILRLTSQAHLCSDGFGLTMFDPKPQEWSQFGNHGKRMRDCMKAQHFNTRVLCLFLTYPNHSCVPWGHWSHLVMSSGSCEA